MRISATPSSFCILRDSIRLSRARQSTAGQQKEREREIPYPAADVTLEETALRIFASLSRLAGLSGSRFRTLENIRRASWALRTFNYGAERPCLSDIPFDARNWKSFGGRFHSTRCARQFTYPRASHLLKSTLPRLRLPLPAAHSPSLFASDIAHCWVSRCQSRRNGNGDEFGSRIHSRDRGRPTAWKRISVGGAEAAPAATAVPGPCDKELNFPLGTLSSGSWRRRRERLKVVRAKCPTMDRNDERGHFFPGSIRVYPSVLEICRVI